MYRIPCSRLISTLHLGGSVFHVGLQKKTPERLIAKWKFQFPQQISQVLGTE